MSDVNYRTKKFIERAKEIHGNKYDYSKVNYVNNRTKVEIICPKHGSFQQIPDNHINRKSGCPKCAIESKRNKLLYSYNKFVNLANKIHNNKYDYSKVKYIDNKTKVIIICSTHGEFKQIPHNHLQGHGCHRCAIEYKANKRRMSKNDFIRKANEIHNNKYDYSKVRYINSQTKVIIICPVHGEFKQIPNKHLIGRGCPKCAHTTSKFEQEISEWIKNNITSNIIRNTRSIIKPYELDIYLPKYKLAIEFNGTYWHSMNRKPFNYHQMKVDLCREKGVCLVHVFEEDYINFKNDIFEEIKCCCGKL